MPELYVPDGFGIVRFKYSLSGDPEEMNITIGFNASTESDVDELAEEFDTLFRATDSLMDATTRLFTGWSYLGANVSFKVDGDWVFGEANTTVNGTSSGETPTVNVAVLVKKRTGLGGRWNRGRLYMPPYMIAESQLSKLGIIDSGETDDLNDRWEVFRQAVDSSAVVNTLVLLHYPRTADMTPDPTNLTSFLVDTLVATQRRRLR